MNIQRKIFISMIALTVACGVAVLASSMLIFSGELNNAKHDKIEAAVTVLENEIREMQIRAQVAAFGMASNPDLIEALINDDLDAIIYLANTLKTMTQIDFCNIVNNEGYVITRTHAPDIYGDNISNQPHVELALEGYSETVITQGAVILLGVYAGAPIYDTENNLIGVISLGFRLDVQDFAYRLKELTGCEISAFLSNQRISTTLFDEEGTYALGGYAPEDVSRIVLTGEVYTGNVAVFGNNLLAQVVPLYGIDEQVMGMIFVGYDTAEDDSKILLFFAIGVFITLIVLSLCVVIAVFLSKMVEREIAAANERLMLMLDTSPVCANIWDEDFNLIDCNKSGVKLYGFKNKQEYKERFFDCWPDIQPDGSDSYEKAPEMLKQAFEEGQKVFEWMHKMPDDDTYIPTEITLVRAKHGNRDVVIGYTRDLREQKEYIAEIEEAREAMRFARDVAENASRSKSIFLANMSHEIRTPMNSIVGFSELALDESISEKAKQYLKNISDNAQWLLNIINDILDSAKIESGKIFIENIAFDLHDVVEQCQLAILSRAEEKGVTLYCYVEPFEGKQLLGDPVRLRQIFTNLLSNAVKFTNEGIVKLLISVVESDDDFATIKFEIKDNGIGMSTEQIARIFEPFMQADDTVTRRFGGTGLGLTITKSIIELMGGVLSVESTPGVGSSFKFELTFGLIEADTENPAQKNMLTGIEKPNFIGEILICEDNAMNQQVICEHLERVGLKTVIANDGKKGVDIITERMQKGEKQFDLIFMDIHMPVMDGLEAAAKIKELAVETPIVALTANIMTHDLKLYERSGMADYLGKPFTSQELWQCLVKYFEVISVTAIDKNQQAAIEELLLKQARINFAKSNQETFAQIKQAADSGDTKTAHRLTHTLKSNAGQIRKNSLQKIAGEIENALSDNQGAISEQQLSTLEAELKSTLAELAPLFEEFNSKTVIETADKEKIQEIIEKLEPLLISKNPDCEDMLDEVRMIPGSEKLAEYIDSFSFKQAQEELLKLKAVVNNF
ncbi:MAG: ATP-binding protein [Oscillospiraceae bacterium]|nr:ATP-binding protein [Oscillospiraceae bacterium]